ncbi:MAG TPA: sigma-70 family RNA polymerase sigma factor [Polyangiaceae bacterium]|nr:sigma-70 family RNA polymerase sigma factor [Polyangiaceae bacterium]
MTAVDSQLLAAAQGGDEHAYQRLVAPYRVRLQAHCYRMLGSLHDAEDALQETLLNAWQGLASFEGRSSLSTWLYTVATHACLKVVARRPRRVLATDYVAPADPRADIPPPAEEVPWLEPYPDGATTDAKLAPDARYEERESVELAFVAALQHLPATQRAVLILRDVLGLSAQEVAAAMGTSVASANSSLQRARDTLERRLPDESQRATRRALGDERLQALLDQFIAAWTRADVDGIVALLSADASFSMPPLPCWFSGSDDIRTFIVERVFQLQWRFVAAHANGQPAMAGYQWNAETGTYRLDLINVFDIRGDRFSAITAFLGHARSLGFGLPAELS